MSPRRSLVTGGAGFIGSHLVDACLARGDEVVVLDDLSTGHRGNLPPGADLRIGDVADGTAVRAAAQGCDVVFHLGALRSVFRSVESPIATNHANVHGTLTVLEAAREVGARVVFASSSSVYGGAQVLPTPESAPLLPRSPYAVSKLAGEHYCRVFSELFGVETVSLRYFNVYGPRQDPGSAYAAVVPLFIDALRSGRAPEVHGDGRQRRAFAYVSDAVAATLLAAEVPPERCSGRAFNIAGGTSSSLIEVLEVLGRTMEIEVSPVHLAPRIGDVRDSAADLSAAADVLGFRPVVDLATGISLTLDWFRERETVDDA